MFAVPNLGLEWAVPYVLYGATLTVFLLSVFWRPIIGLYFFVPLMPLQTIRYRLNDLPLGASLVYLMLLGVALGLIRKGRSIVPRTPWTSLFCVYAVVTFASLCLGSLYLGYPMPWSATDRRLPDWADYMTMPFIFFLVTASVTSVRQARLLLMLMCLSTLMLDRSFWNTVSGHDYSAYAEDLREGGPMGQAGANGLAAFEAQVSTLLVALAATEKTWRWKLAYFALAGFCVVCLLYSLSRGGYLACLAGFLFLGIAKSRKLLLLLALFALNWTAIVPSAVVDRVTMTYDQNGSLDHSSETRVTLWEDALGLMQAHPLMGTGFDTYRYMKRVGEYEDTHNIYLKILVETGVVGLLFFLAILGTSFRQGLKLSRHASDPLLSGLGLGLAGWVICAAVACFFGDRWTYLQIQGWFWVLSGLVAFGCLHLSNPEAEPVAGETAPDDDQTKQLAGQVSALA